MGPGGAFQEVQEVAFAHKNAIKPNKPSCDEGNSKSPMVGTAACISHLVQIIDDLYDLSLLDDPLIDRSGIICLV